MSLTNKHSYSLYSDKNALTYDDFYIIWGNS